MWRWAYEFEDETSLAVEGPVKGIVDRWSRAIQDLHC